MILIILSAIFILILSLALRNRVKTPDESFSPLKVTDFYVDKTTPDYDEIFKEEYTISPGEKKSIENITLTITAVFTPPNKTVFDRGKETTEKIDFVLYKSDGTELEVFTFTKSSAVYTALSFENPKIVYTYVPNPEKYSTLINENLTFKVKVNNVIDSFFNENVMTITLTPSDLSEKDLSDVELSDKFITLRFLPLKIVGSSVSKEVAYSKFRFVRTIDITDVRTGLYDDYLCDTDFIINNVPDNPGRFYMRVEPASGGEPQWVKDIGVVAREANTRLGALAPSGYQLSNDKNEAAQFELVKNNFKQAGFVVSDASKHLLMYKKSGSGYETTPLIVTQTTKTHRVIHAKRNTDGSLAYDVLVRAVSMPIDNISIWRLYKDATFQIVPATTSNPKYTPHADEPSSYEIKEMWFECGDAEWDRWDETAWDMVLVASDRQFCDSRPECKRCDPGSSYGLCHTLDEAPIICRGDKITPTGAAALFTAKGGQ